MAQDLTTILGELALLRAQNEELHTRLAATERQTPIPMPLPSKVKIEKPKVYLGDRDALKIDNWVYSVREYIEAYGLSGQEALRVAVSFTEGLAKLFWRNEAVKFANSRTTISVDLFLQCVSNQFYPNDYVQKLRNRLSKLKQTKSAENYAKDFEGILMQIPSDKWHDEDMKDQFIRGLKTEVKKLVLINDPESLADAVKIANRVDTIVFNASTEPRRQGSSYGGRESDRMEVDHLRFRKNVAKRDRICYNCKQNGHFSRDCPEPPTQETLAAQAKKSGKGQQQQ